MKIFIIILTIFSILPALSFADKIKVITSTTTLKSITQAITGDKLEVISIARPTEDPHFVEVRPSFIMQISSAKLYVSSGMSLDIWAKSLIENARNQSLIIVNASHDIHALDIPTEKVTAQLGDVHPEGNPHYWMNPFNIPIIVKNILTGLNKIAPEYKNDFENNAKSFIAKLKSADQDWQKKLAPFKGTKLVVYHASWIYFAEHFGFRIVAEVEPKPGINPSGAHTQEIIQLITNEKIPVIIQEPYYSSSTTQMIAEKTGAKLLKLTQMVDGSENTSNYIDLMNTIVSKLEGALKK